MDRSDVENVSSRKCEELSKPNPRENDNPETLKQTQNGSVEASQETMASHPNAWFYGSAPTGEVVTSPTLCEEKSEHEADSGGKQQPNAPPADPGNGKRQPCADIPSNQEVLSASALNHSPTLAASFLRTGRYVYWAGRFWWYDGRRYAEVEPDHMEALVRRHLVALHTQHRQWAVSQQRQNEERARAAGEKFTVRELPLTAPKSADVNETLSQIKADAILPQTHALPCWVGTGERRSIISVQNGLLDLERGTPRLLPHNPELFTTASVPYEYRPSACCPQWEVFLQETFAGDVDASQKIAFLQRWFGYCLDFDSSYQTFVVLYGRAGTGKSVICNALLALLGRDNVSCVSPRAMKSRFGLDPALGKLANIVPDLDSEEALDKGVFKLLVDGYEVMSERKYQNPRKVCSTARFLFGTNALPTGKDVHDGMFRRMTPIKCDRVVPADKRNRAMSSPEYWLEQDELPGMLNWALEGLRLLRTEGEMIPPPSSLEAIDRQKRLCDPTHDYIVSTLVPSKDGVVERDAEFERYKRHMEKANNLKDAVGRRKFYEAVEKQFPEVQERQVDRDGRRPRCWVGLARLGC